jgi:hypothetical protein
MINDVLRSEDKQFVMIVLSEKENMNNLIGEKRN